MKTHLLCVLGQLCSNTVPQTSVQAPFCELSSPSPSQPIQNLFGQSTYCSLHPASLYPDPNLPVYLTTHLTSLPRPFSASLPSPHSACLYPDPNLPVYLTLHLQAYSASLTIALILPNLTVHLTLHLASLSRAYSANRSNPQPVCLPPPFC